MDTIIITNNPKVNIKFSDTENVDFRPDADQLEILKAARDLIHLGARLIQHPMAGRIHPNETPYKSVFLEMRKGDTDFESLIIIEDSISETVKFLNNTIHVDYNAFLDDLQLIDCELLETGIEEFRR